MAVRKYTLRKYHTIESKKTILQLNLESSEEVINYMTIKRNLLIIGIYYWHRSSTTRIALVRKIKPAENMSLHTMNNIGKEPI